MKILFVTFGDNTTHLQGLDQAAKRLESQTRSSGIFFEILRFDYNSVRSLPNFEIIEPMFSLDKWGFGYFVWKPFILKWVLENYSELSDYVIYADAGCEFQINEQKQRMLQRIFSDLEKQPILAHFTEIPEILTTKPSVLNSLNSEEDKFRGNVEAGVLYIKTSEAAKSFVSEWFNTCISDDFSALMPPFDHKGLARLDLHRFDQSIFSVMYKNNFELFLIPIRPKMLNIEKLTFLEEFIYSSNLIWPIRNRSGASRLNQSFNHSLISRISFPVYLFYRKARRVKHVIDPRARGDKILSLLIKYKEFGYIARR